jgi:hypothetical protein
MHTSPCGVIIVLQRYMWHSNGQNTEIQPNVFSVVADGEYVRYQGVCT